MVENRGSATPIVELKPEELRKLGEYVYNEFRQTASRILLGLNRYGVHYDITIDSLAMIIGELISMKIEYLGKNASRSELEIEVIDLILDRGREMKVALQAQKGKQTLSQVVAEMIKEAQERGIDTTVSAPAPESEEDPVTESLT